MKYILMMNGTKANFGEYDAIQGDARVADHHRLDAARAHLLELAGDVEAAARHYRSAAAKTANLPERNYLLAQAAPTVGLKGDHPVLQRPKSWTLAACKYILDSSTSRGVAHGPT
jgi:hypothetical protein